MLLSRNSRLPGQNACASDFNALNKRHRAGGSESLLRLYGSLEAWFNQTWRPDDIVLLQ
jgi:hypothetical protein